MLNVADKFNEKIEFNANVYESSFLGKTVKDERVYLVDIYPDKEIASTLDMKYSPETGNFYVSGSTKAIPEEFELLLSDTIQNHYL